MEKTENVEGIMNDSKWESIRSIKEMIQDSTFSITKDESKINEFNDYFLNIEDVLKCPYYNYIITNEIETKLVGILYKNLFLLRSHYSQEEIIEIKQRLKELILLIRDKLDSDYRIFIYKLIEYACFFIKDDTQEKEYREFIDFIIEVIGKDKFVETIHSQKQISFACDYLRYGKYKVLDIFYNKEFGVDINSFEYFTDQKSDKWFYIYNKDKTLNFLMGAIKYKYMDNEHIKYLINRKDINLDAENSKKENALYYSILYNKYEIAIELLKNDIYVNNRYEQSLLYLLDKTDFTIEQKRNILILLIEKEYDFLSDQDIFDKDISLEYMRELLNIFQSNKIDIKPSSSKKILVEVDAFTALMNIDGNYNNLFRLNPENIDAIENEVKFLREQIKKSKEIIDRYSKSLKEANSQLMDYKSKIEKVKETFELEEEGSCIYCGEDCDGYC